MKNTGSDNRICEFINDVKAYMDVQKKQERDNELGRKRDLEVLRELRERTTKGQTISQGFKWESTPLDYIVDNISYNSNIICKHILDENGH